MLRLSTCHTVSPGSTLEVSYTACREYDRLEAEAHKQRCKPKYSLASEDHETLVKSTVDLACNPKLKGRIPSAIKEALANAVGLQELTVGLVLHALYVSTNTQAKHMHCASKHVCVRAGSAQHQQAA